MPFFPQQQHLVQSCCKASCAGRTLKLSACMAVSSSGALYLRRNCGLFMGLLRQGCCDPGAWHGIRDKRDYGSRRVFAAALEGGGIVKAMRVPDGQRISNSRLKPKGDISGDSTAHHTIVMASLSHTPAPACHKGRSSRHAVW